METNSIDRAAAVTSMWMPDATYARTLLSRRYFFYARRRHPSATAGAPVKDSFGNHGTSPSLVMDAGTGGAALRTAVPAPSRSAQMIPFMETVFGAEALGVHKSPHGTGCTLQCGSERHAGD